MTRATLRSRIQERLDSAGGSPYTDDQVNDALNEGVRLFSLLTFCIERTVTLPLDANRPVWSICSFVPDWLAPLRVKCVRRTLASTGSMWDVNLWDETTWDETPIFTDVVTLVRPAKLRDLDALNSAWKNERDGTVQRYGTQGLDQFFTYPSPADNATALRITYVAQAQDIDSDTTEPEIPQEYHPALMSYALCTMPIRFGGSELAMFAPEWSKFIDAVRQCGDWVRSRSKASRYDSEPPQLQLADKSREVKAK